MTPNDRPAGDDEPPVDTTTSQAGLSTTGLGAAELEDEMPPSATTSDPVPVTPVPIDGPTPPDVPPEAAPSITGVVAAEPGGDDSED
jgi:hypothetical protein